MSQETRPSLPAALLEALNELRSGKVSATTALAFSDLGRGDVHAVESIWPAIPEETRVSALRAMDELAENDLAYSFGRLFRIALRDSSPVVRQLAVSALWEDAGTDLIDTLIELMDRDVSVDVRAEAAAALGRFATMAVLDELDAVISAKLRASLLGTAAEMAEPALVRRRALESVAVFGDQCGVDQLIEAALDDDDAAVRSSALYAIGRTASKRWTPIVIGELSSPDAEVRFEAARASGELGDADAIPGLSALMDDSDVEVRQAAILAIGRIGGGGALRILQELAHSCAAGDRETVEEALAEARLAADPLTRL